MKKRLLVIGIITGLIITLIFGFNVSGEKDSFNEPDSFYKVRGQVQIYSSNYGGGYLEWHPILSVIGDTDQLTITYALLFPGHGLEGDIEAYAQIYNPEHTWKSQKFSELIVEITRFGWASQYVIADGHIFNFPEVTSDNIVSSGYVTFKVPID